MFPHCAFTTIISLCVSNGWYCDLKIVCGFKIKSKMGASYRYRYAITILLFNACHGSIRKNIIMEVSKKGT